MTGPKRSDPEETEREKGDVVCCEEISERWDFLLLLFLTFVSLRHRCEDIPATMFSKNKSSYLFFLFLGMTDKLDFLEGDKKMDVDSSAASKKAQNKKG